MSKKQIISGQVTDKRTKKVSPGWAIYYYVTIGTRKFFAPVKVHSSLSIGDCISASYKRNWVLDCDMLVKVNKTKSC